MKMWRFAVTLALLTAACAPEPGTPTVSRVSGTGGDCTGACFFVNSPVKLAGEAVTLPGRSRTFYPTAETLEFVDASRRRWVAPVRTLTDGASIPPIFIPVVGSPRTPEFVNAAAVHDAYCGIGNEAGTRYHAETWQAVHRMFYDTLIVGGTGEIRAKVMFAAVWLGGPRWYPVSGGRDTRHEQAPASARVAAMRAVKARIEADNPSLPVLLTYLAEVEAGLHNSLREPEGEPAPVRVVTVPDDGIVKEIGGGGAQGAVRP